MEGIDTGWERSARAWIDFVDRGDINREWLLDPAMWRILGDVRGLRICDVGCGEGRFCRAMSSRGAEVVGVDVTRALLDVAQSRDPLGRYVLASADRLPLSDAEFDVAISYVALIDIEDFRGAIREMARVVGARGRIVVANLSPFASAAGKGWHRNESGERDYFAIDNYLDERAESADWAGIEIVNWHRPLQSYMRAFLAAGLRLIHFEEPSYTPEQVAKDPTLGFDNRIPLFNLMVWSKES